MYRYQYRRGKRYTRFLLFSWTRDDVSLVLADDTNFNFDIVISFSRYRITISECRKTVAILRYCSIRIKIRTKSSSKKSYRNLKYTTWWNFTPGQWWFFTINRDVNDWNRWSQELSTRTREIPLTIFTRIKYNINYVIRCDRRDSLNTAYRRNTTHWRFEENQKPWTHMT